MTLTYNQQEFRLQCCVAKQIPSWYPGLEFTAFPGRPGDAKDGFFKRMMGVKPGWPDLLFTWNYGILECGVIELKIETGRLSNDQNRRISSLHRLGWKTATCRTARRVHETICEWGHTPKHSSIEEPNYNSWEENLKQGWGFYEKIQTD